MNIGRFFKLLLVLVISSVALQGCFLSEKDKDATPTEVSKENGKANMTAVVNVSAYYNAFDDSTKYFNPASSATIVKAPDHGTLTSIGQPRVQGQFVYQPAPGYTGKDEFELNVCPAGGSCEKRKVTVNVVATSSDTTRLGFEQQFNISVGQFKEVNFYDPSLDVPPYLGIRNSYTYFSFINRTPQFGRVEVPLGARIRTGANRFYVPLTPGTEVLEYAVIRYENGRNIPLYRSRITFNITQGSSFTTESYTTGTTRNDSTLVDFGRNINIPAEHLYPRIFDAPRRGISRLQYNYQGTGTTTPNTLYVFKTTAPGVEEFRHVVFDKRSGKMVYVGKVKITAR